MARLYWPVVEANSSVLYTRNSEKATLTFAGDLAQTGSGIFLRRGMDSQTTDLPVGGPRAFSRIPASHGECCGESAHRCSFPAACDATAHCVAVPTPYVRFRWA
jgi:hypothetical protein